MVANATAFSQRGERIMRQLESRLEVRCAKFTVKGYRENRSCGWISEVECKGLLLPLQNNRH
jgi:hypothetical protein